MPSGERMQRARAQRGFTYLLLLAALALLGAGMAALGQQWAIAGQREREAELLFRGAQFGLALASWRDATPAGQPRAPLRLDELLVDERRSPPRHHLRRVYSDPFTGQPDWILERDAEGRITGVRSRSPQPALRRVRVTLRSGADERQPTVGDWLFEAAAPLPPPAASAPTPTRKPPRP